MKYLSLFRGIGGFELGIQQSYENTRRVHHSGNSQPRDRQNGVTESDGLLQPSGRKDGEKARGDTQNSYSLPAKLDETTRNRPAGAQEQEDYMVGDSANASGEYTWQPPTCIGYSEIDKYAIEIYQKHFPEHKNYGDITKIKAEDLPEFDLIVGGFPCQSFSIAGKRRGFNDTRGTLFFDIARIIKAKQPRLLLLENVKGLLSHDKGDTFRTIIATLDELGYDLQWQVLNSKDHGVPQNRERVLIVGHLRGTSRPEVFPFRETNGATHSGHRSGHSTGEIAQTIRQRYGNGTGSHIQQLNHPKHSNDRIYDPKGISPTLNTMQGGNRQPFIQQRPRGMNKGGKHEIAPTVTGASYKDNNHVNAIRRLTPIERERLQGFPDDWTKGVSNTQRYKCCGNAVTVNVIQAVMEKLL